MKSVVLEQPRTVRLARPDLKRPGPGEALVALRLGGICGSDLAAYRGVSPLVTYPRVLGHELVVDILEAPDRPDLEGRRAVVEPLEPCGSCRACRRGRYNCCTNLRVMGVHIDGGLAERTVVPVRRLYPIPDSLPDELAVLAEPTTIAYRAVERSEIQPGGVAVVFGAGTIGLLIASLLVKARGCRALVIDIDARRLEVARAAGATPVLSENREQVIREVERHTGGELADVVFEATGSAACTRMTTDLVAQTGRIVLVGWNKGPVEFDTVTLMRKEAEVFGSRNSTNAFPPVLRLLEDGVVDASALITHRVGLDAAADALAMLDEGKEPALKVVLSP